MKDSVTPKTGVKGSAYLGWGWNESRAPNLDYIVADNEEEEEDNHIYLNTAIVCNFEVTLGQTLDHSMKNTAILRSVSFL
jgi:hypothetical protein